MRSSEMVPFLTTVTIIRHPDPKRGKQTYRNAINNERLQMIKNILNEGISIYYRGKAETGRIIIGPKDLEDEIRKHDWMFDLGTCTIEELQKAFEKYYPKERLVDFNAAMNSNNENNRPKTIEQKMGDGLKALGIQPMTIEDVFKGKKVSKVPNPYE